jgi:hypothetical protein
MSNENKAKIYTDSYNEMFKNLVEDIRKIVGEDMKFIEEFESQRGYEIYSVDKEYVYAYDKKRLFPLGWLSFRDAVHILNELENEFHIIIK